MIFDLAADRAWRSLVEMRRLLDRDRPWRALATYAFLRRYVLPTLRTTLRTPRHNRELESGRTTVWKGRIPVPWPDRARLDHRLKIDRAPVDFVDFGPDARELGPFGYLLQELTWAAFEVIHRDGRRSLHVNDDGRRAVQLHDQPLDALLREVAIGPPPLLRRLQLEPRPWRPMPAWMPDLSFQFQPHRPPTIFARGGLVLRIRPLRVEPDTPAASFDLAADLLIEEGGPRAIPAWRPASFVWRLEKTLASREHAARSAPPHDPI